MAIQLIRFRKIIRAFKIMAFGLLFLGMQLNAKQPNYTFPNRKPTPPKIIRTCCAFGADLNFVGIPFVKKTDITSLPEIGPHQFLGDRGEGNGIIYTLQGGFIDLAHLRDCADWTATLYGLILKNKLDEEPSIIELGNEGGSKTLTLQIPSNIDSMEALQVAGEIAYEISLWHEIATWFGASFLPFVPERYSSFSPEDLYSNLLGVNLGMAALKSNMDYNEAMTQLIANTLRELGAVASPVATYESMEKVEGIWWTNEKALPSKNILTKRYFDPVGTCLQPWLVPDVNSMVAPYELPKPIAAHKGMYEFSIDLNHKVPIHKILPEQLDRSITQNDFDTLVTYIQQDVEVLGIKLEEKKEKKTKKRLIKKKRRATT